MILLTPKNLIIKQTKLGMDFTPYIIKVLTIFCNKINTVLIYIVGHI